MYKPDNDNIQKANFKANNKWNIPKIKGVQKFDKNIEFIGFNYAKTFQRENKTKFGIHFFLDDYQFNRIWNNPNKYIELLKEFEYVLSPDFSMYTDYPKAMQMWKHFQKHWIGAYLEKNGIKVIPTIGWSDEESYEWCFDGEPTKTIVAVSSIGTQRYEDSRVLFLKGFKKNGSKARTNTNIILGKHSKRIRRRKKHHPYGIHNG